MLASASAALAAPSRIDSGIIVDRTLMSYTATWEYNGQDARNLREQVGGIDGVNASEAEAYLEGLRAEQNGSVAPLLSWDGISPTWWNLTVSETNLQNNSGKVSISYFGELLLTSTVGDYHTFAAQKPASLSAMEVFLILPPSWRIEATTGLTIIGQSNGTVDGTVAGTIATIEISEGTPGGGGSPSNDTTNPVVNAGQDRSVPLGSPATFSGAGADNDPNLTFWWTFTYNGTELNFSGQEIAYTFWALGDYVLTLTAMDTAGNKGNDTLRLTVEKPDQEAPFVDAGGNRTVFAGDQIWMVGDYSDNDPAFPSGARFMWHFEYNGTTLYYPTPSFTFIFWVAGNYTLTFDVTDAWSNVGSDIAVVTVELPDTVPPVISLGDLPTFEAGVPFEVVGNATDNDPAFPQNGQLWWTFEDAGQPVNISGTVLSYTFETVGNRTITLTAVDGWGNRARVQFEAEVLPPDRDAPVVSALGNASAYVGESVRLVGQWNDSDPNCPAQCQFWWTFTLGGVNLNVSVAGNNVSYIFGAEGVYTVWFWARDSWSNTGFDSFEINITAPPAPVVPPTSNGTGPTETPGQGPARESNPLSPKFYTDNPLYLFGLLGLGMAGVFGIVAVRRRSARAALEALPAPHKPAHVVEAVLILNRDGRLIHFQSSGAEAAFESPEVIGSMFTAVTEFIRDSFGKDEALSRLTYGQNTIILERSRHLFGALIVYGEPDNQLAEALTDTLRRLEVAYAGLVERWNGDREAFEGIDGFVAPLLALTAGLTRADVRAAASDKTVRLGSGTEHFKGYIRLRVAMVNQTDQPVLDAKVTVLFNQSVLRLARVEPAGLKQEGFTVHLGDIGPGERLGASYYLDPQTCSQTNIEGVGTYKDAAGESHTVKMKTRMAEIVCPLFFTPQHANPAMMRRLIETALDARDSRVYRVGKLADGTNCNDLFNIAREAVQRHHVVLVRNIKQKEPFEGNAWFYGQTKHSRSPVVIRVTVSQKRRTVEFFVAVDSPATLTGMLAEFQRSFTELMAAQAPSTLVEQVLDDSLKAILSMEGLDPRPGENGEAPRGKNGNSA